MVVGCALGSDTTRIVLLDPPPSTPLGDRPSNGERDERSLSGGRRAEPRRAETNLTADLVKRAARKMRASGGRGFDTLRTQPPEERDGSLSRPEGRIETTVTETIFRGPEGATGTPREIALIHDDYKKDKHHGWLEIG